MEVVDREQKRRAVGKVREEPVEGMGRGKLIGGADFRPRQTEKRADAGSRPAHHGLPLGRSQPSDRTLEQLSCDPEGHLAFELTPSRG